MYQYTMEMRQTMNKQFGYVWASCRLLVALLIIRFFIAVLTVPAQSRLSRPNRLPVHTVPYKPPPESSLQVTVSI
nr:hypothetical protein [Tanacetum cinerariifolium]